LARRSMAYRYRAFLKFHMRDSAWRVPNDAKSIVVVCVRKGFSLRSSPNGVWVR
jgi:phage-related protein